VSESRANLELKARDPDPERTLAAARSLGAGDRGHLRQRDTYFIVLRGRLKLREEPGGAELIHYLRRNSCDPGESRYRRVAVDDPEATRTVLGDACGVAGLVAKDRHLLIHDGIRIHLDRVDGLGSFVELEALLERGEEPERHRARLLALSRELQIDDAARVAHGYLDLLAFERFGPLAL
jgi:adenylate cyclase class IV